MVGTLHESPTSAFTEFLCTLLRVRACVRACIIHSKVLKRLIDFIVKLISLTSCLKLKEEFKKPIELIILLE